METFIALIPVLTFSIFIILNEYITKKRCEEYYVMGYKRGANDAKEKIIEELKKWSQE